MSRSNFHGNKPKRGRDDKICFDFLKGSCTRENCRFLHADPSTLPSPAEVPNNTKGGDWKKRTRNDEVANNDNSNSDRREYSALSEDRHKGSFPIEDIKNSEEFTRRVDISDGIKRKYAICFGYLGTNYAGLQINPGIISVEAYLEKALLLSGAIIESNFGNLQKIQWSRAARTDRGVHAVGQCIAAKITVPMVGREPALVESMNSFLPPDIRVFTMTKVAKSFNAKNYCSKRIYQYLLPSYTLINYAETNAELEVVGGQSSSDPASEGARLLAARKKSFRADPATVKKFRDALAPFVGTHSFHNFTTGYLPGDSQSRRYILSFDCGEPFVDPVHGTEWILVSIYGQSFLLNQIRRMIGLAVDVARGSCGMETIAAAFSPKKVDVPMVPGLGLYLNELFFDTYNIRVERNFDPSLARKPKSEAVGDNAETATAGGGGGGAIEAPASAQEDRENNEENENNEDQGNNETSNEQLLWHSSSDNVAKFQKFKDEFIWRHIFEQEDSSLAFLVYLDFLRLNPFSYEVKDYNKSSSKPKRLNDDDDE